jgi:hypothetical protein
MGETLMDNFEQAHELLRSANTIPQDPQQAQLSATIGLGRAVLALVGAIESANALASEL